MKIKKISIVLILSVVAFCGCNHQNGSQIDNVNSGNYSGFALECVSKYPELNTKDVAIGTSQYDPIIVSPYASDDVVRALAHIIYENKISSYCFGNYLYDKYDDDFSNYEKVYEIIQSRIEEDREQADLFIGQLKASIENDSEINISPDGEYYYLLDMNNFEESVDAIQASVDRQAELFDFDMTFYCEYYFSYDGRTFIGGYRGPMYSVYLDSFSPENKIYEYYYWKAKNEWVKIYTDLYISQIYDYTKISEKLDVNSDYVKRLNCWSNFYDSQPDIGLYEIDFTYSMFTDDFDLSEAVELAYEVYTNVRGANAEYNTNEICGMRIDINNFTGYNKEYNRIFVFIPFDEEYTPEELKIILEDNIEKKFDGEPV
ncbi:MAG: hypothetical protein J5625_06490 [Lachnospiraceae bacterium]|nr:hypothetical protein [Lachnospiraceae bacterium]